MTKKTGNTKKTIKKAPETTYSHSEILNAASSFGEVKEVVAGALRIANKEQLTRSEVESSIRKFKTRKVQ